MLDDHSELLQATLLERLAQLREGSTGELPQLLDELATEVHAGDFARTIEAFGWERLVELVESEGSLSFCLPSSRPTTN